MRSAAAMKNLVLKVKKYNVKKVIKTPILSLIAEPVSPFAYWRSAKLVFYAQVPCILVDVVLGHVK